MLITFTDGTVAEVSAADTVLGGVRNKLTVHVPNADRGEPQSQHGGAHAPDADVFELGVHQREARDEGGLVVPGSPDEDWMHGWSSTRISPSDRARATAEVGKCPGWDVLEVVYAAYIPVEEARRVELR